LCSSKLGDEVQNEDLEKAGAVDTCLESKAAEFLRSAYSSRREAGWEGQSEQERKCANEYRRLHNENIGTATLFPERVFKKIF
jgi:hypothetical protein